MRPVHPLLVAVLAGSLAVLGCGGAKHPGPMTPQVIVHDADSPHEGDPGGKVPDKPQSSESVRDTGVDCRIRHDR
jgi:hypothetical protein